MRKNAGNFIFCVVAGGQAHRAPSQKKMNPIMRYLSLGRRVVRLLPGKKRPVMSEPFYSRLQQIRLWQDKLLFAQLRYRQAVRQHSRMVAELGEGAVAAPDGAFAVASARRAKALAYADYVRIQGIYKDLVARGIQPPVDEEDALL